MVMDMATALMLRGVDAFDASALAELRVASLIEMGLLAPPEAAAFLPRARREFWTLLREERMTAWVLVAEGVVAGCACVNFWNRLPYPGTSVHAELSGVYVAPPYRRRGIARELVGEALAAARSRGARRIFVHPTESSRDLYRRLGFEDSGQLRSG